MEVENSLAQFDCDHFCPSEHDKSDNTEGEQQRPDAEAAEPMEAQQEKLPVVNPMAVSPSASTDAADGGGDSGDAGGWLIPIQRPPARSEIEEDLGKYQAIAANARPFYTFSSPADQLAWKQTPTFSGKQSPWDRLRTETKHNIQPPPYVIRSIVGHPLTDMQIRRGT